MIHPEQQANQDAEHLRLLSIFHTVVAGLTALFACIFITHIVIGITALRNPGSFDTGPGAPPGPMFGWMFLMAGTIAVLGGWTMATLTFLAGRYLKRRIRYTFCLVVAALNCMLMPFGTVLGVFTLIVLLRSGVKAMFQQPQAYPIPRPMRETPA
ncbi:MAG: hypothetical protein JO306_07400 [Gemmatimonadetes bacterium]|nr:hypothetical protein [Gemmatimonadota bacterium]